MSYVSEYLQETITIASQIDQQAIEKLVQGLAEIQNANDRVYILGLGGSLANAIHLAADLRMRCAIGTEAPQSLPELTAWANDYGWALMFVRWLEARDLGAADMVLVLSVGGGDVPSGTSLPLVHALQYARRVRATTAGIVGAPGGVSNTLVDVLVRIPLVAPARKTEHCEGWQGVLHHLIVSHPRLRRA